MSPYVNKKNLDSAWNRDFFCKFAICNVKIKYFGNTFNRPSYTAAYDNSNGTFLHRYFSQSYNILHNNVHIAAMFSDGFI